LGGPQLNYAKFKVTQTETISPTLDVLVYTPVVSAIRVVLQWGNILTKLILLLQKEKLIWIKDTTSPVKWKLV
jgi:hypothetical protein